MGCPEALLPPARTGGRPRKTEMRPWLMPSSTATAMAVSGERCPTIFPDGGPSTTTLRRGNETELGRPSMTPSDVESGRRAGRRANPQCRRVSIARPIKTTEGGGEHGYDGAKRITGRKHHISVDTMGLLLAVAVTSAAVDDAAAAPKVLGQLTRKSFPRLRKLWADTKYHNHALNRWVSKNGWYVIEIVSRLTGDRRFKLLPWRWVVERTFGWLGRCRIHSKDYEHLTDSSEVQIRISMIQLMLRRLTGAKYRDRFRYKRPRRRTTA